MAAQYNLTADAGADFTITFTYENGSGDPIDLTDYTATMSFAPQFGSFPTLLMLTSDPVAGIVIGGVLGTFECTLTAVQTAALPRGGAYMLTITAPDTLITRLVQGEFVMNPGAPV